MRSRETQQNKFIEDNQNSRISLSVIFPVYNEAKRLGKTMEALKTLWGRSDISTEVIFVDDGSTDETSEILSRFTKQYPIKVISNSKNMGKGAAVRAGLLEAGGEYSLVLDADMSTEFSQLAHFIPHMRHGSPFIIGSRRMIGSRITERQPRYREELGRLYAFFSRVVTGIWIEDVGCGFKCFRQDVGKNLATASVINRWAYDVEFISVAHNVYNYDIVEVPVIWKHDNGSSVRVFRDALPTFFDLLRIHVRSILKKY